MYYIDIYKKKESFWARVFTFVIKKTRKNLNFTTNVCWKSHYECTKTRPILCVLANLNLLCQLCVFSSLDFSMENCWYRINFVVNFSTLLLHFPLLYFKFSFSLLWISVALLIIEKFLVFFSIFIAKVVVVLFQRTLDNKTAKVFLS